MIAAFQLPSLFGDWFTVDDTIVSAVASAQQQVGVLASVNPVWLLAAAVAGLSFAAVATLERA